ncbi:MAG: hypothetical protein U0T73_10380 [Chitinophagales bacterium]
MKKLFVGTFAALLLFGSTVVYGQGTMTVNFYSVPLTKVYNEKELLSLKRDVYLTPGIYNVSVNERDNSLVVRTTTYVTLDKVKVVFKNYAASVPTFTKTDQEDAHELELLALDRQRVKN